MTTLDDASNNNNLIIDEPTGLRIEDIPELQDNSRFVITNSQEFKRAATPPPPPEPDPKNVTFREPPQPAPYKKPKRKNPEVENLMSELRDEALDKAAYERQRKKDEAELKQKIGLVAQINGYSDPQKFPGARAKANLKKAKYTEDDDLKTLLAAKEQLERAIGTSSADQVAVDYFGWMLKGIETLNRNRVLMGMDTTGLSDRTAEVLPSFKQELDELVIKYQWFFYQPPELRFVTKLVKLLWSIDYMNRHGLAATTNADYSTVDPETADRYSDL